MVVATLDDITQREILLSIILLKPGKRIFLVEDLKKGLDRISVEYPRLKMSWNLISKIFFIYHPLLCYELNLPHYGLGREGQTIIQKEFNGYSSELQNKLKEISQKVWQYCD